MNIERIKGTRHNHVPEREREKRKDYTGLLMNPFFKLTAGMIRSLNSFSHQIINQPCMPLRLATLSRGTRSVPLCFFLANSLTS
jgi:hypothetical protein